MEQKSVPREKELVIANIAKITKFGAYCKLPEYGELEVFLPIREVSSGWIKNIREFIHEGQRVVVEVVLFDKDKNTIDVSLKRVPAAKAKAKIRDYNLEKRLAGLFAQAVKVSKEENKDALIATALAEFKTYTELVYNATENTQLYADSKLPKSLKETLIKVLELNRKKKRYVVSYIMRLYTYNTMGGATELRKLLGDVKGVGIEVSYIGAPRYRLVSEDVDYTKAEDKIRAAETMIRERLTKGVFEIEKEKLKKAKEDILAEI
ncbi:MAG: S1 RNA-binding domain-containing protein [Candidatus Micrarchaeota archaeon]|nr:S1 RNA-binding domain-containing protein [Candidatus Micrarchaeota archaeon]